MYKKLIEKVETIVYEAADIIDDIKKPRVNEKGINDFVTEVDIKISQFLCDKLPMLVKESVALSEEGSIVNPEKGYYWVIDPIDGTSNFIYGIPDYGAAVFGELFKDCIDYRITGSAALDCCYIACGRGGVFVSENLKPWDYAAGVIIIQEAGGVMTQWDGEALRYFGGSTFLATNGQLHKEVLERIKEAYAKKRR